MSQLLSPDELEKNTMIKSIYFFLESCFCENMG